ncbi:MAG: L,D-transpeptidase [Bacteroidales bacterium]
MKRSYIAIILMLGCNLLSCNAKENTLINYDKSLPDLIRDMRVDAKKISVLIDKSDYKLTLLCDTVVIKEYPVVFGGNPVDDKLRQGDQCTPEGNFQIISKYPHQHWSKFIWLNYPTRDSWANHNRAKAAGTIPEDSKIGGEIGIHGVPNNLNSLVDLRRNWTLGCISMKNNDVDEIYPYINKETKIHIRK